MFLRPFKLLTYVYLKVLQIRVQIAYVDFATFTLEKVNIAI